ncbi:MAG TPA: hypothetical protein VH309_15245 [Elusimicrobiota bacterium]|jgi:hypothetical protein|nr:hypothetical protein [Elusimicrobiota bacterium]
MLLPALLAAALAAVPASASPAVRLASCLHPAAGKPPASFDGLRACQARARSAAVAAAAGKGAPLTDAQLDALDDAQRAEARKFFAQPSIVTTGPPAPPETARTSAPPGKLGGATAADLSRADPKSAAAIEGLQGRLQAAAGDGKDGVTPAMADDVRATLLQAQGGLSPDMQDLLDGVQADGGKLTPATMLKLQNAGKAAKGDGLDLNIDPNAEKQLLDTDLSKDQTDPDASPAGM